MVVALTAISMLALLDKYILSLLVTPIKQDLALSDTQISLVIGLSFAIANIAIGIPAGWAADRFSRRAIVACGVIGWSLLAMLCAFSQSFGLLFLARAGVGLFEGIIPPACYSLIRDGITPSRRGRAFGIYAMANTLGPGLSMVLGGVLVGAFAHAAWLSGGSLATLRPWQLTVIAIGLGGLPLCLFAFAFPDPGRGEGDMAPAPAFSQAWDFARSHRETFLPLALFSGGQAMVATSIAVWLPALLGRKYGLTPQQIGPTLGLLLLIAGPLGLFVAGSLIDRLAGGGRAGASRVAVLVGVSLLIFGTLVPQMPSLASFWFVETCLLLCSTSFLAITSTVVAHTVPSNMVGMVMSMLLMLQGLVGAGLSPTIVALGSDHLFSAAAFPLAMSLSAVVLVFGSCALAGAIALRRANP